MKVGSVVFATNQGIGILAKSFYDNGVVNDVTVLAHGRRKDHQEWYPNSKLIHSVDCGELRKFCDTCDVMFFFETPFDWGLFEYCKNKGIKTVLMVMYECMPKILPAQPDLILSPSLLDQQYYPHGKLIPIPVDRTWKQRNKALKFVHNAGHGGLNGRNGTQELVDAWEYVKSPVEIIVRSQSQGHDWMKRNAAGGRIEFKHGAVDYSSLYSDGDVFIFPEKFNGLSLPLQEAYASGMLVMATDRFPMNTWLPTEPLIPARGWITSAVSPRCNIFNESIIKPADIAANIDWWYGKNITEYSLRGKKWAEENSWAQLKLRYMEMLEGLLQ